MMGIIVQLAISWLLVWLFEKGNLSFLGFYPSKKRLLHFALFFTIAGLCCTMGFFLKMYIAHQQWILNPQLNISLILEGIGWNIKAVLFEELIFRGALLYILIKKPGSIKAIIISATAFGVYHWFSHELFWNIKAMAMEFVAGGLMGLLLAYAYAKTYSLYIPVAYILAGTLWHRLYFRMAPLASNFLLKYCQGRLLQLVILIFLLYCCYQY
jgi:uncharacterized protein